MRILILGAGGIGGYFGARLIQAGANVDFLVRPARAARLAAEGLSITSPRGDFHCWPRILAPGDSAPPFDLAILTCKAYDLESAVEAIAPWLSRATPVLPLLNGVAHLEKLDRAFGRHRVFGGVAHLSVMQRPDGEIAHLNGYHRLIAGARGPTGEDVLHRLKARLDASGVDCRISGDIGQELWDKLIFLATLAGVTSSLRSPIGDILETDYGPYFITELLNECLAVAAAAGHGPDPERLAGYRSQLLERGSSLKSSLLRDMERGHRTEGEHILGDMVRRGNRAGLRIPLLSLCYSRIEAWEAGCRQPEMAA